MATLRDVAREAGVSVATASRAINGLGNVTAPPRAAVMAAVKKLNFVPHSGARSLTRRTTDTVGVILPDLFGEFFSEIIRCIDLDWQSVVQGKRVAGQVALGGGVTNH